MMRISRSRTLELIVLAAFFLIPRIGYVGWFTQKSALFQDCDCSARELCAGFPGSWIESAQLMTKGQLPPPHDDIGMPLVIAGISKLGLSFEVSYWVALTLILLLGLSLFLALAIYLAGKFNRKLALVLSLGLALYPQGWYYSFCNVSRILPVYAFLAAFLIYLFRREIFSTFDLKRFFIWSGASLLLLFFYFARSSTKLIFFSLFLALLSDAFLSKGKKTGIVIFGAVFLSLFFLTKQILPKSQHVFWHAMYLYLADFDRKYNFEATDDFSHQAALAVNKSLLTEAHRAIIPENIETHPEYEPTMKRLYFQAIRSDPSWFAKILFLRTAKLFVIPFQGSWLPPISKPQEKTAFYLGQLTSGGQYLPYRLYIALDVVSIVLDLMLSLMGTAALILVGRRWGWEKLVPPFFLLASSLYIYIIVGTANRTIYLAGTYFYLFFSMFFVLELLNMARNYLNRSWLADFSTRVLWEVKKPVEDKR